MRYTAITIILLVIIVLLALYFTMTKKQAPSAVSTPNPSNASNIASSTAAAESLYQSYAIPANGLVLSSPAFSDGGMIPQRYACDGDKIQPELRIGGVDPAAKALLLWVNDPDAPMPGGFDHWILYNLPATTTVIAEGYKKAASNPGKDYTPPCPPSGTHRYIFRLFSLKEAISPSKPTDWKTVEPEILRTALQRSTLMGLYMKQGS